MSVEEKSSGGIMEIESSGEQKEEIQFSLT